MLKNILKISGWVALVAAIVLAGFATWVFSNRKVDRITLFGT